MNEHEVRTALFPVLARLGLNDAATSIICLGGAPCFRVERVRVVAGEIDATGECEDIMHCFLEAASKQDAIQRLTDAGLL
jgi:hypothetical protein